MTKISSKLDLIGSITADHHQAFLEMNQEFVQALAPMDQAGMLALINCASYARQIGDGQGALLGYLNNDPYDSENINWVRARYERFAYIDRIVIAAAAQGKGYGRALYDDFAEFGRQNNCTHLLCEVNTRPANPASHQFHLAVGFMPVGEQETKGGKVAVRYYAKRL